MAVNRKKRNEQQERSGGWDCVLSSLNVFCVVWALLVLLSSCASVADRSTVLATVDGEQITEGDLEYALSIAHRREDLSSAGSLELSIYVQRLISDRLITQEARHIGFDKRDDIRKKVDAFLLREAVVKLREEEILGKIAVTKEELREYYSKNYEKFSLRFIKTASEEAAKGVLERLRKGEGFEEVRREIAADADKKHGGEIVRTLRQMPLPLADALRGLNPGAYTDIVALRDGYYVIQFQARSAAPVDEFERELPAIENALRQQKEKERGEAYLSLLREKATIKIDRDLLASITLTQDKEDAQRLLSDERTLAEVHGAAIRVKDFVVHMDPHGRRSKEEVLNSLIDIKLVDAEALSRHYEKDPDFEAMVKRYEDQLLRNKFIDEVIIPKISISDADVQECYVKHQKSFLKPFSYHLQQITVNTREEAEELLSSLRSGSDFAWLAKSRSVDSVAKDGGDAGWLARDQIPKELRETVERLEPGEVSGIVTRDKAFVIVRLKERTGGEAEELVKIKTEVERLCIQDRVRALYDGFVDRLKAEAVIETDDQAIMDLERRIRK